MDALGTNNVREFIAHGQSKDCAGWSDIDTRPQKGDKTTPGPGPPAAVIIHIRVTHWNRQGSDFCHPEKHRMSFVSHGRL